VPVATALLVIAADAGPARPKANAAHSIRIARNPRFGRLAKIGNADGTCTAK
jgi:hypothetical protein